MTSAAAQNSPRRRPAIAAELKRQVLVEAGHKCAIPKCRESDPIIHHIVPWKTCRRHEYENLIALCSNCHHRADRGRIDKKSLRIYKSNLRFAIERFSQFEVDVLFELAYPKETAPVRMPYYMRLLIKRVLDIGYVTFVDPGALPASMAIGPVTLQLTAKGKKFIRNLGSSDNGY